MPQKDYPQHRHEVVARRQLRVRTKIVRRLPQIVFELLDVTLGIGGHALGWSDAGSGMFAGGGGKGKAAKEGVAEPV